jgi:hypothetical protein
VNRRLLDRQIRLTCRELMSGNTRVSGRTLRRTLRERYGAAGKTDRVFRIWREEISAAAEAARHQPPVEVSELQRRLVDAERTAADNKARAELAELREQAHQDRWAMEIDALRQAALAQPNYALENRSLEQKIIRLTAELNAWKTLATKS